MRVQVVAMVENCPSGALTYEIDGAVNEPLVPEQRRFEIRVEGAVVGFAEYVHEGSSVPLRAYRDRPEF